LLWILRSQELSSGWWVTVLWQPFSCSGWWFEVGAVSCTLLMVIQFTLVWLMIATMLLAKLPWHGLREKTVDYGTTWLDYIARPSAIPNQLRCSKHQFVCWFTTWSIGKCLL
jgi:hypothetical protein